AVQITRRKVHHFIACERAGEAQVEYEGQGIAIAARGRSRGIHGALAVVDATRASKREGSAQTEAVVGDQIQYTCRTAVGEIAGLPPAQKFFDRDVADTKSRPAVRIVDRDRKPLCPPGAGPGPGRARLRTAPATANRAAADVPEHRDRAASSVGLIHDC